MAEMKAFTLWFLDTIPDFLMSDPIKYLWGLALLGYILKLILNLRRY